jgi:hypothetical protein
MKALISPNEGNVVSWVESWVKENDEWIPVIAEITGTERVAEVCDVQFDVALPLYWVDCPENCIADLWYFKDGQCYTKPTDTPKPE